MGVRKSLRVLKGGTTAIGVVIERLPTSLVSALICSTIALWYIFMWDFSMEPELWDVIPDDVLAPRLDASELMSLPLASGHDIYAMPRYLHQSWMNNEIPRKLSRWSQSCRAQHRHWHWVLWTDEDNLQMVNTYFPWFLDTYNALPAGINRADAARNMYMYLFGGVYADLDTECLQPLDSLFRYHQVALTEYNQTQRSEQISLKENDAHVAFFGRMDFDGFAWTLPHTIPNAWMAASPGHPLFLLVLERLKDAVDATKKGRYRDTAESLTGPVSLFYVIEEYNQRVNDGLSFDTYFEYNPSYKLFNRTNKNIRLELLPPEIIYPFSWNRVGRPYRSACWAASRWYNSVKCKKMLVTNQSYAISYWSHTWNTNLHKLHHKGRMDSVS